MTGETRYTRPHLPLGRRERVSRSTTSCGSRTTRPRACMPRRAARHGPGHGDRPRPDQRRPRARRSVPTCWSAARSRPSSPTSTCVSTSTCIDITPAQHDEIQRLRTDIRELLPYLRYQGIYTSLNHVASGINGPLTGAHVAAILPWVDAPRGDQWDAVARAEQDGAVRGAGRGEAHDCRQRLAHRPRHRPDLDGSARAPAPARSSCRAFAPAAPMRRRPARRPDDDDVGLLCASPATSGRGDDHDGRGVRRLARLRADLRRHPGSADRAARDDRRVRALHARAASSIGICCTTWSRSPRERWRASPRRSRLRRTIVPFGALVESRSLRCHSRN